MGESPSRVRYGVLAALCLAAVVAYVQRNSIGMAEEEIRRALHVSKKEMGWVISAFFLTYALFQLPTGFLGKIWGTRKALSFFAAVFSAAAGCFALATGMWSLLVARLAMGGTQAGIFPCAVNTISKWMPDTRRSFSSGMLGGFMSVGGAAGMVVTGWLLYFNVDWRWIFAFYCVPGLLFAVLFYYWFRDRPEQHGSVNEAERELIRGPKKGSGAFFQAGPEGASQKKLTTPFSDEHETQSQDTPWREILTSPAILALCGQQVFRAAGYMFFASWFATYLRETREIDNRAVGILTSLPLLAVVIGSPIGGVVSDWVLARTGNRRLSRQGVAATAMLACCLLVLVAYPIDNPWLAVALISAGSFCAAFGGPCAYTSTIDMGGRHVPMVFSTMNMAGNIGAFLFPIIVPWLLSENELYVNRFELKAANAGTSVVIEAETDKQRHSAKLKTKFGNEDDTVLQFHHGTRSTRTIFSEYDLPYKGAYEFRVDYAGLDPPPLRLIVNGKTISEDIIDRNPKVGATFWPDEEVFYKSKSVTLNLPKENNLIRLETQTYASGNWDLVLFLFAAIYLAACVCWLFANTNVTIGGK